jgi:signal peptidase II
MLRYLWLALIVILLDQGTKFLVLQSFRPYEVLQLLPVFNLTLVFNEGAAFSFLSDAGGWQRWFFIVLAIVVSLVLVVWIARLQEHEKLTALALSLVVGGAIGNVIDRILYGHVVDFLDFHWEHLHYPAFNVADSAIFVGVILMLWDGLFGSGRQNR